MAMALQQARANVRIASGLDILAGLWMVVAPFLLNYSFQTAALWNSVISGLAVAILAGRREWGEGYRYAAPSWINAGIGAWLVVSPFILGFETGGVAWWNHIVVGIGVVVFALWSALSTPRDVT